MTDRNLNTEIPLGESAGRHEDSAGANSDDVTKTRWYAITDLAVKIVSGFAIVVIGIAGWRLQASEDNKHEEETKRIRTMEANERAERKYLPALRSITEADLILVETAADYSWRTHSKAEVTEESRLGTHLAYCGASLFFPDGEPSFGITSARDNQNGASSPLLINVPARASVLMLANLMRLAPLFRRKDVPGMRIRYQDGELVFQDKNGVKVDSCSVDRRAAKAWKAWLPQDAMTLHELAYEVDIDTFADDLHAELGNLAEAIVNKNPEVLSPEYVKIRDDVLRSRDALLPRKQ